MATEITQIGEILLTAKEVGAKLSLSKRAVFRMRSAGLICSPVKVGAGAIRWRLSDIEQWIAWGCPSKVDFEAMRQAERQR